MVHIAVSPTTTKTTTTMVDLNTSITTTQLQEEEEQQLKGPDNDKRSSEMMEEQQRSLGKWDIIIPNPKARKHPRLCFFVTALTFLMVAAVVIIFVIKISLASRKQPCCGNITNLLSNEGEDSSEFEQKLGLSFDISWEMKRALLELRQIMGDFQPFSMFPLYRKDLTFNYIAYYEIKLKHQDGFSYAVISTGERTGDYSLVETGGIPSPLDKLREKAFINGHYCSKFFRLTTDGVTICEDYRLNRIVATTGDIYPNSPITTDWEKLDEQVSKILPQVKLDWQRMASVVNKVKEWKISEESTVQDSEEEDITERGLYSGDFTEIPIENVTKMRIKFVGLTKHKTRQPQTVNVSLRLLWQHRLCKVLNNICNPIKPTTIHQNAPQFMFAGSKYLKLTVNSDQKYVKMTLRNQEVRFQVELNMAAGQHIVMHYGIALGGPRRGRSVERSTYKIPDEHLFPSIHHDTGSCLSTTTMVAAWAMIFSYYDTLARSKPQLGYRRLGFHRRKSGKGNDKHILHTIASKLDMTCSTRQVKNWDKTRLENWFQSKNGPHAKILYISGQNKRPRATRKAINLLGKGIPVLISIEHEFKVNPQYGVVTRMRQQRWSYRRCHYGKCSLWRDAALTEFYVKDSLRTEGRWQTACTYHAAAAVIH